MDDGKEIISLEHGIDGEDARGGLIVNDADENRIRELMEVVLARFERHMDEKLSEINARFRVVEQHTQRFDFIQRQLGEVSASLNHVHQQLHGDMEKPGLATLVSLHQQKIRGFEAHQDKQWSTFKWAVGLIWGAIVALAATMAGALFKGR